MEVNMIYVPEFRMDVVGIMIEYCFCISPTLNRFTGCHRMRALLCDLLKNEL